MSIPGQTFVRARSLLLIAISAALAGCSVYPLPEDVISIPSEKIVLHARCEMRSAVINWIRIGWDSSATEAEVIGFVEKTQAKVKQYLKEKKKDSPLKPTDFEADVWQFMDVSVAYSFDFNITENNKANADVAFKLPFTPPGVLDVDAAAGVNLTRQGQRQFKAQDLWGKLVKQKELCDGVSSRRRNVAYPLDGSIGVSRVVDSFIQITLQGGAKDSFVDTLVFTTVVGGGANAAVKLSSVPHSFRLVSAGANLSASRTDIHKVTYSLVFPRPIVLKAISGVDRAEGDLNAPFDRPTPWRARYNLCVADARDREDKFNNLRESPPELYCITYADQFAPQYGSSADSTVASTASKKRVTLQPGTNKDQPGPPVGPGLRRSDPPDQDIEPSAPRGQRSLRPNNVPLFRY